MGLPRDVVGKLIRCCYGTRDAGQIWEDCYVTALVGLGFEQGRASPCSFYHKKWKMSIVVHGDDFTALGTDASLDLYETGLAKYFELKIKGRLGLDAKDDKEMRVLNRIVRVDASGLKYEADPRHVELLAQSLNLQGCNPVATPGIKKPFEDSIMDVVINDDLVTTNLAPVIASATRKVSFCETVTRHATKAYSDRFPIHPRCFVFGKSGQFIMLKSGEDPFTGETMEEMDRKRIEQALIYQNSEALARKRKVLRHVLINGNPLKESNGVLIAKVSKKCVKKRLGAKAVKAAERLSECGEYLDDKESTTYRQLAARANYLAMDRPDIGYATKELCRHFAKPTKYSVEALKRLVRFLVGRPRLVWFYPMQPSSNRCNTFVDTDYGGCHTTRRSTSCGSMMHGGHLIKHWATTQSTVALSSAEAELTGICKGAAQGLGLQALARDLGLDWSLSVLTDATAAIGICRRRGLGKIRHLATADLWVQDRIKKGDVQLLKVPGVANPADVLTKHVDRTILDKHMITMNLKFEDGRAKSAPSI